MSKVKSEEVTFPKDIKISIEAKLFCLELLTKDPDQRLGHNLD